MNLRFDGLFAEIRTGVSRMQNRCANHISFLWQMSCDFNLHEPCMTAYGKDLLLFATFLRRKPWKQNMKLKCCCLYWHKMELNLPFTLRERLWWSGMTCRWIPYPYKLILTCCGQSLALRRLDRTTRGRLWWRIGLRCVTYCTSGTVGSWLRIPIWH
jgi:hypothetical protein